MRLQLRVAELGNAYLALAAALVGLIDGERDPAGRLERAYEAVDARLAALTRAGEAMQRFLAEHGRMDEAADLAAEVAAVVAPVPIITPGATTAATG